MMNGSEIWSSAHIYRRVVCSAVGPEPARKRLHKDGFTYYLMTVLDIASNFSICSIDFFDIPEIYLGFKGKSKRVQIKKMP